MQKTKQITNKKRFENVKLDILHRKLTKVSQKYLKKKRTKIEKLTPRENFFSEQYFAKSSKKKRAFFKIWFCKQQIKKSVGDKRLFSFQNQP